MGLHRWMGGVLGWLVVAGMAWAADTERNPKPNPNGLPMVLERIHNHAQKDEWKDAGWSDATIEKWLENAVAAVGTAAGKADLKLPIKFSDVQALDPKARRGRLVGGGGLIVGTNVEVAHLQRTIILADGNAEVSFADNCIIVARGVVSVPHCNNSLIVSGTLVEIAHDGNGIRNPAGGSVVLCRGGVDISHATGTMIVAHEGASVSHAHSATFLGGEPQTSHRDAACQVVKLPPDFPVEPRLAHAWEKKIAMLGAVKPKGIVFRFEGKRYVAELNSPIVNESGEKVAALEGWQVTFVGDEMAALSDGRVDIPFRLPQD